MLSNSNRLLCLWFDSLSIFFRDKTAFIEGGVRITDFALQIVFFVALVVGAPTIVIRVYRAFA